MPGKHPYRHLVEMKEGVLAHAKAALADPAASERQRRLAKKILEFFGDERRARPE